MKSNGCEKCEDRGVTHGVECIVRKIIFDRDFNGRDGIKKTRKQALEAAVATVERYIQTRKETNMSELVHSNSNLSLEQRFNYTPGQMQYIRNKVCQNATDDELVQFFYRCSVLKLDPLMPGQIYFLKFKRRNSKPGEDAYSPGAIVIGIDGFRSLASRTGQLSGIRRGVIRDQKGACIGGWADVYRKDWEHPAHLEVSLAEYADPYKDTWRSMPESMIQKVAEAAALRMAFSETLGGIYSQEEMDQAKRKEREVESTVVQPPKQQPIMVEQETRPPLVQTHAVQAEPQMAPKADGICCGRKMMVSKFPDKATGDYPLYCVTCKSKQPQKKTEPSEPNDLSVASSFENFQNSEISQISENLTYPEETKAPQTVENKPHELPWKKYLPADQDPRMVK